MAPLQYSNSGGWSEIKVVSVSPPRWSVRAHGCRRHETGVREEIAESAGAVLRRPTLPKLDTKRGERETRSIFVATDVVERECDRRFEDTSIESFPGHGHPLSLRSEEHSRCPPSAVYMQVSRPSDIQSPWHASWALRCPPSAADRRCPRPHSHHSHVHIAGTPDALPRLLTCRWPSPTGTVWRAYLGTAPCGHPPRLARLASPCPPR